MYKLSKSKKKGKLCFLASGIKSKLLPADHCKLPHTNFISQRSFNLFHHDLLVICVGYISQVYVCAEIE